MIKVLWVTVFFMFLVSLLAAVYEGAAEAMLALLLALVSGLASRLFLRVREAPEEAARLKKRLHLVEGTTLALGLISFAFPLSFCLNISLGLAVIVYGVGMKIEKGAK